MIRDLNLSLSHKALVRTLTERRDGLREPGRDHQRATGPSNLEARDGQTDVAGDDQLRGTDADPRLQGQVPAQERLLDPLPSLSHLHEPAVTRESPGVRPGGWEDRQIQLDGRPVSERADVERGST